MTIKLLGCLTLFFVGCNAQNTDTKHETPLKNNKKEQCTIAISIKSPIKNVPLILYEPINNECNFNYYPTQNEIEIEKDTTIIIRRVSSEVNTYILRYGIARAILSVFPSDSIGVSIITNPNGYSMYFTGTDSVFHKKYNEDAYKIFMDKGFDTVIAKKPEPSPTMIAKLKNYITNKTKFIDTLYKSDRMSEEKYHYYKKLYAYSIASISPGPISIYYRQANNSDRGWFNELYKAYPPFDPISLKCLYGSSYIVKYCYDIKTKRTNVYNGMYDTTWQTFSPYSNYGYAPDFIQHALWGEMLLILSKNNTGEIDIRKAFQKYANKFPQSDYIPLIKNLQSKKERVFAGKFINSQPSSLLQLWKSNFKGSPVFIDLWATWCVPCIAEFEYTDQLEKFLQTKGIKMLYLSMDETKNKAVWEKLVRNYQLNSYNILANNSLKQDILNKVYGSNDWSIPRYVLIDKNGVIVLKDALRPSNEKELYAQIEESLN